MMPCALYPLCCQVRKLDWFMWMTSFLSTMFLGVEMGLAISIGLALRCCTPGFWLKPNSGDAGERMYKLTSQCCPVRVVVVLQVRKLDWFVWMTSFLSTMFLGVEMGLAISIGLALLIVIYESAFPHTALLGRVGNTTIYRNVKQFPNSQVRAGGKDCARQSVLLTSSMCLQHRHSSQRGAAFNCKQSGGPRRR
jgi:hypothetical protein